MPRRLPWRSRAAHDPAQHVAAALVAGQDAVRDEERRGAQVVGDHAQGRVVGRVPAVASCRPAWRHCRQQRREQVRVVVGRPPCTTAARRSRPMPVSTLCAGRGSSVPRPRPVELHEDQVPDLEPAVALALTPQARAAGACRAGQCVALEEVDLGAGAAGAGVAHGPEVVLHPELEHALGAARARARSRAPRVARDAVLALEDRDREPVRRQRQLARQELPGRTHRRPA